MGSTRNPNMTPSSTADIGAGHPAIYLRNKLFVVEVAAWIQKRMDSGRIGWWKLSFDNQIRSELLHLSI